MYSDIIDSLTNLPNFEDVKTVNFNNSMFYLELKDGSVLDLFDVTESLTRAEFENITKYLVGAMKESVYV